MDTPEPRAGAVTGLGRKGATAVLVLLLLMTFGAACLNAYVTATRAEQDFERRVEGLRHGIAAHLHQQEVLLRGAQGLFAASTQVTANEWRRYVERVGVEQSFHGVQGLGFSQELAPLDSEALGAKTSVLYLEPPDPAMQGFDLAADPARRTAMEQSLASGQAVASMAAFHGDEEDPSQRLGVFLFSPVVSGNGRLRGWVFSEFRVGTLMRDLAADVTPELSFTLRDGADVGAPLIFEGGNLAASTGFSSHEVIQLPGGRVWGLAARDNAGWLTGRELAQQLSLLALGILVSLLTFVVLLTATREGRQARALAAASHAELTRSEANFHTLFDSLDDLLFVLDQEGRVININPRVTARLGYSLEELQGRHMLDLRPASRRAEAAKSMADMLAGNTVTCPVPMLARDGTQLPVETRLLKGTWNGRPATFCLSKDISELRRSEEQFSKIFASNPNPMGLSMVDTGLSIAVNDAMVAFFGQPRESLVGQTFSARSVVDAERRALVLEALRRDGRVRDLPMQVDAAHGTRDVLFSAEQFEVQDLRLLLTVLVDVTELRRTESELKIARESAEAANRAKSWFLAMMSHEIRTPLNGVLGMAELLQRAAKDPAQRDGLGIIQSAGETLLGIINDVLDFSKIEAGQLELSKAPFDVTRAVGDVCELLQPRARPGVDFSVQVDDTLPGLVLGDALRFRQVLTNLVGNALKFTETGRVEVRVERVAPRTSDLLELKVCVVDTGVGIALEARDRLFRVYSQESADTQRRFGGTGLGLAITKRLVEAMGGTIGVDSEPGRGSTFWFEIKVPVVTEQRLLVSEAATTQALRGTVLLAEDEPVSRLVAERMLAALGLEVLTAGNGRAALEQFQQGGFDLVLMDMEMPELDGLGATRAIRGLEGVRQVPIVALSANALSSDRERCLAAGMNDFLSKPYRLEQLRLVLTRWLPRSSPTSRVPLSSTADSV